jgi:threonine dehydratase
LTEEVLYRFEYPERPGGMSEFLSRVSGRWNVSLWNYRNHGSDVARVLVGMQVPSHERKEFAEFIAQLGFNAFDETHNPAYVYFIK